MKISCAVIIVSCAILSLTACEKKTHGMKPYVRCDVTISSSVGKIEAKTDSSEFANKVGLSGPVFIWQPLTENKRIKLYIGYQNSTSLQYKLTGGHFSFNFGAGHPPDKLIINLKGSPSKQWMVGKTNMEFGPDWDGAMGVDVGFSDSDGGALRGLDTAIENGKDIAVTFVDNNSRLATAEFDLSDGNERDRLFGLAAQKARAHDPEFCSDKPLPVRKMY